MYKEDKRKSLWALDVKKELPDVLNRTVVSPLHYGDTLEIFFVRGIEGETYINGKRFEFEYSNVFFIPPRHLHKSFYRKGGLGEDHVICAFHINIDGLAPFMDIKKILFSDDMTLYSFPARFYDFDGIMEIIRGILDDKRLFSARLADLLRLFESFLGQSEKDTERVEYNLSAIQIVDWIEEHYAERLSIKDASDHFGFSKYYFCKWFKSNTGVTFNEFLNGVRINHACAHLINGCSVEDTAERCGYSDPSYFTKVFKQFRGMTPKAYVSKKDI